MGIPDLEGDGGSFETREQARNAALGMLSKFLGWGAEQTAPRRIEECKHGGWGVVWELLTGKFARLRYDPNDPKGESYDLEVSDRGNGERKHTVHFRIGNGGR